MDLFSLLRMMGALLMVLGLLAGGLWVVRRYDLRLPGALTGMARPRGAEPRLAMVERLSIDARRSIALIRRDDREHLLLLTAEGMHLIEAGIAIPHVTAFQEEVARHDHD